MIKEAIILCGGAGTRLKTVNPVLPKSLVPIAGKPFLYYLITYLQQQGIDRFILATGYGHDTILSFINNEFTTLNVQFSKENQALGTGGAIQMAAKKATTQMVLVVNGDTLFKVDIKKLYLFHLSNQADCTLALKPLAHTGRYGLVELNANNQVNRFREKQFHADGLINGGVYILNLNALIALQLPASFSFEKDYLEKNVPSKKIFGMEQDKFFIDIGLPEDLERAQKEFINI